MRQSPQHALYGQFSVCFEVLGLIGYLQLAFKAASCWLFHSCQDLDVSALPNSIGPQDPHHLAPADDPRLGLQPEGRILHGKSVIGNEGWDLLLYSGGMYLEVDGGVAKANILLGQVAAKVLVDAHPHPFGPGYHAISTGNAIDEMNVFRQQVKQGQVVLNHHHRLIFSQALQYAGGVDALVDIKVRADLIEEVEISVFCRRSCDGHPLQLAAAEAGDVSVHEL